MKIFLIPIIIFICSIISTVNAQETSVEKSLFGVQTGTFGVWAHNESRLSDKIALRTEFGFDLGFFSQGYSNTGFVLAPTLNLEPRWYYNIKKRAEKGKNISDNSANFVTMKLGYTSNAFLISNDHRVVVPNQINVIPKWAIKRMINEHFTYEAGAGAGLRFFPNSMDSNVVAIDVHLRIGYNF